MRLPMMARSRVSLVPLLTTVATASLLLAGCAGDATSPSAAQPKTLSALRTSPFVPTDAQRALVGVADGTYTYEIDPTQAQSLTFGASHLDIPANAVCDLATSSYGVGTWNDSCEPQTQPFTITAVVRNADTDHPSVEFQPALRFNPQSNANLYLYVTDQATLDNTKVMYYCNETGCVDEAQTDADLASNVDVENKVVFRRIKHFSGYVVAEFSASPLSLSVDLGF
ncbi:MAG TPA: hypothetical protein VFY85_11385 [Gemmatimonadaceae bacterium]|nr:hypothetical protein [Gemmatimonadaceae bacterium]